VLLTNLGELTYFVFQLCCWLRLNKLFLGYTLLVKAIKMKDHKEASNAKKISWMAFMVFAIIHVCACIWFYIGSRYKVMNSDCF
jgi:hypothetical protein